MASEHPSTPTPETPNTTRQDDPGSRPTPALEHLLNQTNLPAYVTGRADQILFDLLVTGRAAMPDGEIVEAFPQDSKAFPTSPLTAREPTEP